MSFNAFYENPKNWWFRWIVFIPCAIAAYLACYAFVNFLNRMTQLFYENDGIILWAKAIASTFIATFYFIKVGVDIAPKHKKNIGLTLFSISMLMVGISIYSLSQSKFDVIYLLETIGMLVGSIYGYKSVGEDSTS